MNNIERLNTIKNTYSNIPESIANKLDRNLHNQKNHPIEIIKNKIYKHLKGLTKYNFQFFDNISPIVSVSDNFDKLLIPKDHPARSKSDTYYINETTVLRTHTSAHQNELLNNGITSFVVTGDVYRKDEINATHYPVFHQMELLSVLDETDNAETELKELLSGLVQHLFPGCNYRFNDDYFPFTHPSYEIEVEYRGKWLEILGCGICQPAILEANGIIGKKAIACGFGLERLAMIFANIPDIRYLWSTSERFLNQFADGELHTFILYSDLPSLTKDISFYVPENRLKEYVWLDENDFFEIIRDCIGTTMEEVKLECTFFNAKRNKYSRTYRMVHSPNDDGMKNPSEFTSFVNSQQEELQKRLKESTLKIELR